MSQSNTNVGHARRVCDTNPIDPHSEPSVRGQKKEPGGSVAILTVVKDSLKDGLAFSGAHRRQSDH